MKALQIVVLGSLAEENAALRALLDTMEESQVAESSDSGEAMRLSTEHSADLLLCGLNLGGLDCDALLRQVAQLKPTPAVAFFGEGTDISQIERQCLKFGLIYLGLLSQPFCPVRLKRMVHQVEALRLSGTIS